MLRPLLISLLFGLSPIAGAQPQASREAPAATPFWLPRGALLGTYVRAGAVTPQARLQWQFTLVRERTDGLVLLLEGGVGFAAARPEGMDAFYEHTLMIGGGYRNQQPSGLHWGFQVTGGPLWYGAHLSDLPDERYTAGLVEGRVHLGYQVGRVALGVSAGYGEPFNFRRRSVARQFLGGVLLGFFADWR